MFFSSSQQPISFDYPVHFLRSRFVCHSFRMIKSHPNPDLGPGLGYKRPLLVLTTVFSIFWPSTHAACYFPDATLADDVFQPCDPGDEHSMCCSNSTEKCRSDGLCYLPATFTVWRETCTDPTWKSSNCLKLFDSGVGMRNF